MKRLLSLVAATTVAFALPAGAESVQRAAAVVNNIVISNWDLDQRVRMILSTSGGAQGAEAQRRMREQVLRTLIDEILQLTAAKEAEIEITDAEVEASIDKIAEQNKTTKRQIIASLAANGVYVNTLKVQIQAELAWSRLIEERIAPRIRVTDDRVDQEMRRIQEGANKPQYLVSEIFFAVDTPADEGRARRAIDQIYAQMQSGAPFPTLAQEFSESATAARGGDLGWIQDADVPPEVWAQLQRMRPPSVSEPIRTAGGYYLIALRDKMRPAGAAEEKPPTPPGRPAGVPAGSVKLKRVVLGLPPQMTKQQEENVLRAAAGIRNAIKGCQGLEEFIAQIQGVGLVDLPILPISDLAPEVRGAIQGLNPSDVSQPYYSNEGGQHLLNMLVVCGDKPRVEFTPTRAFEMPTREQVENRMFNQELSSAARRYMRDLRRDATIEIRDASVRSAVSN